MKIIYLLPMLSLSLFAHPDSNIFHFHYAEYIVYALVGVVIFNIIRIFLRRYI